MAVVTCESMESFRDELEATMGRVLVSEFERFRRQVRSDFQSEVGSLLRLARWQHGDQRCSSALAVAEKAEQKDGWPPRTYSAGSMRTKHVSNDDLQELILDLEGQESAQPTLPGQVEMELADSEPPLTPIPCAAEGDNPAEHAKSRQVRGRPPVSAVAIKRAQNHGGQANETASDEGGKLSGIVPQAEGSGRASSMVMRSFRSSDNTASGVSGTRSSGIADRRRPGNSRIVDGSFPRSFVPATFKHSLDVTEVPTSEAESSVEFQWRKYRGFVQAFVESTLFDFFSGMLIILNAIAIGTQTAYMARHALAAVPSGYAIVERLFCFFFTVELAVRMVAYGLLLFDARTTSGRWAIFDGIVVGLQLFEIAADSILEGGTAADSQNMSFMRVMRILRLVRVIRVVRIIRFLGELRTIVSSVMNSMRALFWTFILLMLGIYVVGVYFTQLVLDYRITRERPLDLQEERLLTYFGDLPRAILSLYQAMSGGVDWGEMSEPLIDHISPVQGIVFVIYIAFTVLALMNVVTGVFVEGSLRRAKQEEQQYIVAQLRSMFREVDCDHSGKLSVSEFQSLLDRHDMVQYMKEIDVDLDEAQALFVILDMDQSGQIDYNEFVFGCLRLRGAARAFDVMLLSHDQRQANFTLMRRFDRLEAKCERIFDVCQGSSR